MRTWNGELTSSHYDLKHIYKLILESQIYQLSSISGDRRPQGAANFARYPLRRLDAEMLIDAICQITGVPEEYSSAIPEPYTFMPEGQRAISASGRKHIERLPGIIRPPSARFRPRIREE